MHVPDLKHEFEISPHILLQVVICGIHKVTEFAPQNVVEVLWNEFRFNAFPKELSSVTMVLPLLLFQCPPPCGGIAFQVRLGKLHSWMSSNLNDMYIILHFSKPSIHNLSVMSTIKVPKLGWLISRIFGWPPFEGRDQLTEVGPIHFEEDCQLFQGEYDRALLFLFTFELLLVFPGS
jgi:hypothetical protein